MTVGIGLDSLAEKVIFVRFLNYVVSLYYPSPYCALWKDIIMCSSHFRNTELCSTSVRVKYLPRLFGVLLHGRLHHQILIHLSALLVLKAPRILILQYHLSSSEYKPKPDERKKRIITQGAECCADSHFQMTSVPVIIFPPTKVHLTQFRVLREDHTAVSHLSLNLFPMSRCQMSDYNHQL